MGLGQTTGISGLTTLMDNCKVAHGANTSAAAAAAQAGAGAPGARTYCRLVAPGATTKVGDSCGGVGGRESALLLRCRDIRSIASPHPQASRRRRCYIPSLPPLPPSLTPGAAQNLLPLTTAAGGSLELSLAAPAVNPGDELQYSGIKLKETLAGGAVRLWALVYDSAGGLWRWPAAEMAFCAADRGEAAAAAAERGSGRPCCGRRLAAAAAAPSLQPPGRLSLWRHQRQLPHASSQHTSLRH